MYYDCIELRRRTQCVHVERVGINLQNPLKFLHSTAIETTYKVAMNALSNFSKGVEN